MSELMTTREVADYLRIKERKVYDLVRNGDIPCTRVTGKWLFPKALIDRWVGGRTEIPDGLAGEVASASTPPPIVAGSHDPLLDWALRESHSDLALQPGGSLDGLRRLAAGAALAAGTHAPDEDGEYSAKSVAGALAGQPAVVREWAWRRQGLVVAPGNPHGLKSINDLARPGLRVALRQEGSGSRILLEQLLAGAGMAAGDLAGLDEVAHSESDLALAVLAGKADAGLAIEASAREHRLDFVPLARERYDLVLMRRAYFEPPIQALLAFARTRRFAERAGEFGGYEVGGLGNVMFNAP